MVGLRLRSWKFVITALVLMSFPLLAGENLSLDQAIDRALAESPRLKAGDSEVAAAAARRGMAASGLYPQVSASASYIQTNNPMWAFGTKLNQGNIEMSDFNPDTLNHPDDIDNYQGAISVVMPVFDSGQTWISLGQADLDRRAADLGRERVRQEVIHDVVISYAGAARARDQLTLIDKSLETARAHEKFVTDRYEAGMVDKSDHLRAQLRVSELEQARLSAESGRQVAQAALNAAMGDDASTEYEIAEGLEPGPEITEPLQYYIDLAQERRPDLNQARLYLSLSDQEIKKTQAAYLPSVYLAGSWEANSEDLQDPKYNYNMGVMVKMNLFNGFRDYSNVKQAQADESRAAEMLRQMELMVSLQVRQAYANALSARRRIDLAAASVTQAEEGNRIVADRYQTGLYTIVNLLDAETALQQARVNQLGALYDYTAAKADLALAAGIMEKDFRQER